MFVNELDSSKELIVLSISDDEWTDSFNFWILEKFESNCIDSLLEDIDLIDEVKKSEQNDDRNWWNSESNDEIEDEKKRFMCELTYFDVVNNSFEEIFFSFDEMLKFVWVLLSEWWFWNN
jgi:hypothetical protein